MIDEARVYFTPAFMIASLQSPEAADTVPDDFVWNLKETLSKKFNPLQLRTIIHFIEFHLSDEPWKDPDWRKQLALAQRIEQNAAGEPATRAESK